MKKIFLAILLVVFIIPLMISCGGEVASGTSAAKFLLSQERLNKDVIDGTSNLFTNGKEAFERVVKETKRYNKKFAGRPNEAYVEVEGDTYKWYNDKEYSNFNSFFESYAINIEHSAKNGAELIDYVKKNIRSVDIWVDSGDKEYLLKVDKTSEIIITRDDSERIEICKRTTDDNGKDVYELLIIDTEISIRMKYIPDLLYEFSILFNNTTNDAHYLVADKSKGYWNIISTTGIHSTTHPDGLVFEGVSFEVMMMKDEGYYQFSYAHDNQGWARKDINSVTLISNDGQTDLVTIGIGNAILYNTGLKGIDHMELTASKEYVGDYDPNDRAEKYIYIQDNVDENNKPYKIYSTSGHKSATVVLENGKSITEGDRFFDGIVNIDRIDVRYVAGCDAYGIIPMRMLTESLDETFDYLVAFLEETGMSFRRDLNTVLKSAEFALKDVENFSEYFQFNGYNINSLENARLAIDAEYKKITELEEIYNNVKDVEVIKRRNQNEIDSNIYFADVEVVNNGTNKNTDLEVSINDFKLKVQDTILFVEGDKYKVVYALQKEDGNIVPININNQKEVEYIKNVDVEITETEKFTIPQIESGTYTLVAYIATSEEGIRVTKPIPVSGDFKESTSTQDGIKINLTPNNNYLIITSVYDFDIYLETSESFTYRELIHYMGQSAYNHGMVDENTVEVLVGNEWKLLEEKGDKVENGKYRMKYIVTLENIDSETGYVYLTLS